MKICKGDGFILVCKLGEKEVNCYDGTYDRDTLKTWSRKGILRCPQCGEQYTYNHGKVRIPYFKHLNSDCVMYGEPETEEHIQGKIDLFEWIQKQDGVTDVRLEGWLPETKQRPDIMFKYNGEQYVLEYQCSPISSEYIERHNLYQAAGIHDIWICGTENYMQWYHDGDGNKRENYLESICQRYYDPKLKMFFFHYSLIPEGSMIQKRHIRFNQIEDIPYVYHDICVEQVKQNLFAYDINDVWFLNGDFAISYDSLEQYENQYIELRCDIDTIVNNIMSDCVIKYQNHITYNYTWNTIDVMDLHDFNEKKRFNIPINYITGTTNYAKTDYAINDCEILVRRISSEVELFAEQVVKRFENIDFVNQVEDIPNRIQSFVNKNKTYRFLFESCKLFNFKFDSSYIYSFSVNIDLTNDCFIRIDVKSNIKSFDLFVVKKQTSIKRLKSECLYHRKVDFNVEDINDYIVKIISELNIIFHYLSSINYVFKKISDLSNETWRIDFYETFNICQVSMRALCLQSHGLKCVDFNIEDYFTIDDFRNGYNIDDFESALKQDLRNELFHFVTHHPFLKFNNK